jgi:hypothetical protein
MVLGKRRWQRDPGRRLWSSALVTVLATAAGLVSAAPAQAGDSSSYPASVTLTSTNSASVEASCKQITLPPTVINGSVYGTAFTHCIGIVMPELHILVEMLYFGFDTGAHGEELAFGSNNVEARATDDCVPGIWNTYAQTYFIAPPGYLPPEGIIYAAGDSGTAVISATDCLPVIINMPDGGARTKISQLGLTVGTVSYQPSNAPVNSVISWSLRADNTTVDLVEALGVSVPGVRYEDWLAAGNEIRAAGLVVGNVTTQQVFTDADSNKVLHQFPEAGVRVDAGTAVNIIVGVRAGGGDGGGGGGEDPPPPGCRVVCP